jgi:regulator of sigma E protease
MTEFITSLVAFVVALGLLVAVHEYGHFWVARKLGVKVLRFCIGFGKPIWSRVAGEDRVEYAVAAIPLGGYVKLLDEREGPVPEPDRHRSFNAQTPPRRIAILAAGPAFNFFFAIAAYWLMFVTGVTALKPVIGAVEPESIAAEAGIVPNDEIIRVDGVETPTLMDAQLGILSGLVEEGRVSLQLRDADGATRAAVLEIDGDRRRFTEPGELFPGLGLTRWHPTVPPQVADVAPDGSAAASGLQAGDLIVSADGEQIANWSQWVEYVRARPDQTVPIVIERGGATMDVELAIGSVDSEAGPIGRIGAGVTLPENPYSPVLTEQRFGPLAAVGQGIERTWSMSVLTVKMIYRMIVGDVSPRNISGPINIASAAGMTASAGLAAFLSFLAIVSISLGILNLLPIPLLDGGQIAYQVAEMAKGSPVSEKAQMVGQQVGIVLLLLLMSVAFYNDILRLTS